MTARNRWDVSLEWLGQAAAALDAAHANGIVHRDVKPANLLLDNDERVKVADFGVASAADLGSFTEAGTVVGTAGYLAPEQARGERATPASDLYALAVVAFELLTGKRPFERESSTAEAMAHVSAPIPPASDSDPQLPRELDDVLARGLAKEPEHRFATAADFVDSLRDALGRAAGTTRVAAIAPVPPARSRRRVPLLLLLLARRRARSPASSPQPSSPAATARPPARRRRSTVQKTVTLPGATVVRTVTTAPEPPATTTAASPPATERDPSSTTRASSCCAPAATRRRCRCSSRPSPGSRATAASPRRTRATTSPSRASRSAGATASSSCSTARSRCRDGGRRSAGCERKPSGTAATSEPRRLQELASLAAYWRS